MSFGSFLSNYWQMLLYGIAGLATAAFALFWSKYLVRFLLVIATIAIAIFAFTYKFPGDIDERLPDAFREWLHYWFFGLGLVTLYSLAHLVATLVRVSAGPEADTASADGPFADLQAAWQEILIQLSKARIDPAGKDLYLLIGPDESLAASVTGAAGLQFFAKAPAAPEAPIHCQAVSDALFLSCAGASALGRQDSEGTARLEYICRLIASLNPERPILRGIAILLPFDWAGRPDFLRQSSAMRDDLQTIRRTFRLRCPTLTIFCLQESIPGFNDFASRLPSNLRHQRCGFSVPLSQGTETAVIRRGMVWMTRWFHVWSLNLMVANIQDKDGNGRLLSMNSAMRANRDGLVRILESGLTVHQQDEPILYRGCYFVACGPMPENYAFAAGLLNGARKGRLMADRDLTTWSREAEQLDRNYRRAACAIGLASIAATLPIWTLGIIPTPGGTLSKFGLAALAVLGLVWAGVLFRPRFRKKTPVEA